MIQFVYGGSGSGKSEFAESLVMKYGVEKKIYLATMQVYGKEGEERVLRHKKLRSGKGFITVEQTCNIQDAVPKFNLYCDEGEVKVVLLECLSNLVANEMFKNNEIVSMDFVVTKIWDDLKCLMNKVSHLVIVSNNIFEDGVVYDKDTTNYMKALGKLNQMLIEICDEAYEVVVGIPLKIK